MIEEPLLDKYRRREKQKETPLLKVFGGIEVGSEKRVLITLLNPDVVSSEQFLVRFDTVAETLQELDAAGVVTFLDYGKRDGQVVLVREDVKGETLAEMLVNSEGLSLDLVLDIARQLGDSLQALHQADLVHGGLNPERVLLSAEGSVLLLDVGLAHGLNLNDLLASGQLEPRPYHAPELIAGEPLSPCVDFYALGVILYEGLTGETPSSREDVWPGNQRPGLPPELDELVAKCLNRHPSRRIQSAYEFLDGVEEVRRGLEKGAQNTLIGMEDSLVGQTLGGYRLVERLGQGGMATVYKAYESKLGRYVAIKVLPQFFARDPNFMRRFQREAKAVAQLSHPNIVPIHNYGEQGEFAYIAMQYVEGGTLKHEHDKQLEPEEALRLLLPVIRALDYAHERGIVHRDIKPGNILLNEDGWPLLADFGLARMAEASVKLTGTGVGVGTPMYMSPEQGQGLEVDRRTDIYSLGIVLYELLTGDVPFKADTPMAVVVKHMTAAMPMPREVNPEIPEELEQIILKATAKNPENRYQTAAAMAAALKEAMENLSQAQQPAPAIPDSAETTPPSESKFKLKPLYLGFLAVLILVVSGLGLFSGRASSLGVALGLGATDTPRVTQIASTATPLPSSTSAPTSTALPSSTPALTATQLPTSTPAPTLGAGSEKMSSADGMTMLYVPAGEFLMGASENEGLEDEKPQHTVYLDAFWIDQTEVTNAMYAAFLNDRGNQIEGGSYWLDADSEEALIVQGGDQWQPKDDYADHPVLEVTWYGARAYCDWAGRRLPSEAEWEKAARGTDGRKRPWGNSMPTSGAEGCKYEWAGRIDCGAMGPIPVGSLPLGASPYGAMDMGGNVREWVQDLYGENYYAISVLDNPKGPSSGSYRVLRGGGWKHGNGWTRTTKRYSANPITSDNYTGFRCAADVAP